MTELAPDYLKVDMSFVRGIHEDPARQEILKALTSIAWRIDARIIAEGIETDAELKTLRELAISYGQGYRIGRAGELAREDRLRRAESRKPMADQPHPPPDIAPEQFFTSWIPGIVRDDPQRSAKLGATDAVLEFNLEGKGAARSSCMSATVRSRGSSGPPRSRTSGSPSICRHRVS